MKKFFYLVVAVATLTFVSCKKENNVAPIIEEEQSFDVNKLILDVVVDAMDKGAAVPGRHNAIKTAWENGDKINILFDENTLLSKKFDLVIKYNGTAWVVDETAVVSGRSPQASGTLKAFFEGFNDYNTYFNEYGLINGYGYVDGTNTGATPMMAAAKDIAYTYASSTLTANINAWTFLTDVQIVITGLDPANAANYYLKGSRLRNNTGVEFTASDIIIRKRDINWQKGIANADGVAFNYLLDQDSENYNFTFTLWDVTGYTKKAFTINGTIHKDNTKCQSIKIDASNFTNFIAGNVDGWALEVIESNRLKLLAGTAFGGSIYSGAVVVPAQVTIDGNPYTINSIGRNAFSGCTSLTSVTLPEGITSIDAGAFEGTSLTSLTIPASVSTIDDGNAVFTGSSNLAISVAAGSTHFQVTNEALYSLNSGNPYQLYFVSEGKTGDLVLESTTKKIASNSALYNTALSSIEFPAGFGFNSGESLWGAFRGTINDGLVLKFNYTTAAEYKAKFRDPIQNYNFGQGNISKIVLSVPAAVSDADLAELQTWGATFKSVVRRAE